MNKAITILLVATTSFWACDTKDSIAPLDDSFFVKLYAGISEGDQFGEDIIATSDGGLLIAATSSNTDGSSEILLIKTDEIGNELWTYGASADLGPASFSVAKSVIELLDSYVVGGTIGVGDGRKSIIIKISFEGTFSDSTIVSTDEIGTPYYNQLSKITLGLSGILVSGETSHPKGAAGGTNGFMGLFDLGLQPIPKSSGPNVYFGLAGDEIITGAYEVSDNLELATGGTRFLAFGSTANLVDPPRGYDFTFIDYNSDFSTFNDFGTNSFNEPGDQISASVNHDGDNYWLIGETETNLEPRMFLVGWQYSTAFNKWAPIDGSEVVGGAQNVSGKGITIQKPGQYVIVGDLGITVDHTEMYLARVDNNRDILPPWPKTYGAQAATYSSSAVITLADGSIVMVGTADLKPIQKVLVIKTGPNGEMSF